MYASAYDSCGEAWSQQDTVASYEGANNAMAVEKVYTYTYVPYSMVT
jgi:hypothetical protein